MLKGKVLPRVLKKPVDLEFDSCKADKRTVSRSRDVLLSTVETILSSFLNSELLCMFTPVYSTSSYAALSYSNVIVSPAKQAAFSICHGPSVITTY